MTAPKLFISYCWTNDAHVQRVVELATNLQSNHVDVILDKWALREGQDAYAFMERTVRDPSIQKVLIVCDRAYAAKANNRSGGVGVETQIITPALYGNVEQTKFVVLSVERDKAGAPVTPTYYGARVYIDFSVPELRKRSFEQLLRWAHDAPAYEKPQLGTRPTLGAWNQQRDDQLRIETLLRYTPSAENSRGRGVVVNVQRGPDLVEEEVDVEFDVVNESAVAQQITRVTVETKDAITAIQPQTLPLTLQPRTSAQFIVQPEHFVPVTLSDDGEIVSKPVLNIGVRDGLGREHLLGEAERTRLVQSCASLPLRIQALTHRRSGERSVGFRVVDPCWLTRK